MEGINPKDIKYFGVEVIETYYKNGKFKSFQKKEWIRTNKKIYVDKRISEIRKLFPDVVLIKKQEHRKQKKIGKVVKAISKTYEVIEKGTKYLSKEKFKELLYCNKKKALFEMKDSLYYYVINNIYRDTETNDYYFIDKEKQKLVETGFNMLENPPSKIDLLMFIKDY